MKTRVRPMTALGAVAVVALLGTVVRALAAGPAYTPRPKDVASAAREVSPPSGLADERARSPAAASSAARASSSPRSARPASPERPRA